MRLRTHLLKLGSVFRPLPPFGTRFLPMVRRQGGGGAPVLRPTLAGHRRKPPSEAPSTRDLRCPRWQTPRMGPTPGGTTATLLHTALACNAIACRSGAGAGGLGYGRRPPFAVSSTFARDHGIDGAALAGRQRCPASVGPENVPQATCSRSTSACIADAQSAATDRKPQFPNAESFHASRDAPNTVKQRA